MHRELQGVALRLRQVYSLLVIVESLIQAQQGDNDFDIAHCLRFGALEPVAAQTIRLERFARRLQRSVPA